MKPAKALRVLGRSRSRMLIDSFLSELIINLSLLWITQNLESIGDLDELILGPRVFVSIRVVFE